MRSLILPETLVPLEGERPIAYADRIGRAYSLTTSAIHKKSLGQYLTPIAVADFMASLVRREEDELCILDPGSGSGVLACAVAERMCREGPRTKRLLIDAYECDIGLLPLLDRSLQYLGQQLDRHGISLEYRAIAADFVLEHGSALRRGGSLFQIDSERREYDIVVGNPPYFKLPKSDPRALAASQVVHGQPNIYALFMAISASLLKPDGELIFITPRSFTSGPYFKRFREQFFSKLQLEALHVFDSRRDAFSRDRVLQENLIIKGRCRHIGEKLNKKAPVQISVSTGTTDINECNIREVEFSSLLDMRSSEKMLRITTVRLTPERFSVIQTFSTSYVEPCVYAT